MHSFDFRPKATERRHFRHETRRHLFSGWRRRPEAPSPQQTPAVDTPELEFELPTALTPSLIGFAALTWMKPS